MHSMLFIATIPDHRHDWAEFVERSTMKLPPYEGVVRLAENVWLLNLQKSVAPLGWLVSTAEQMGVSYGLLPFEREPEWLPADFDPNTILAHRPGDRG